MLLNRIIATAVFLIDFVIILVLIFLCCCKNVNTIEDANGYEQLVPKIKISAPASHLPSNLNLKPTSIKMPQVLVSDGESGEQTPAELEDEVFSTSPVRQNRSQPGSVYSTPPPYPERSFQPALPINYHYPQNQ